MKKSLVITVIVLCMVFVFSACAPSAQPAAQATPAAQESAEASMEASTEATTNAPIKIGVTWCTMAAPAVQYVANGSIKRAEESGIELITLDAQGDAQKQADQVRNLITQGVDAIILNPMDSKSIVPVAKEAFDAGIPIITAAINIDPSGEQYITSFAGADEVESGMIAGGLAIEALGEAGGKVAIIEGAAGAISAGQRTQGFEEKVAENAKIEIVTKQPTASWDRAEAMTIMEDLLVKHPDLALVYTHDDNMAIGAIEAIKAAGKMKDIKVVAVGITKDGVEAIKAGELYGTSEFPLGNGGITYVDAAVAAAKGETVEKWIKDQLMAITSANIEGYEAKY